MFGACSEEPCTNLCVQRWARVVGVDFAAGQGLTPHPAPSDVAQVCTAGSHRLAEEGITRRLQPRDGVATPPGQGQPFESRGTGPALLLLRQTGGPE